MPCPHSGAAESFPSLPRSLQKCGAFMITLCLLLWLHHILSRSSDWQKKVKYICGCEGIFVGARVRLCFCISIQAPGPCIEMHKQRNAYTDTPTFYIATKVWLLEYQNIIYSLPWATLPTKEGKNQWGSMGWESLAKMTRETHGVVLGVCPSSCKHPVPSKTDK